MSLTKTGVQYNNGIISVIGVPTTDILTVNFLISNHCQLDCSYCIAKDRLNTEPMATKEELDKSIAVIRKLDPLVVVLSGGEPLLHQHWQYVVEQLSPDFNIIIDTNGLLLPNIPLDFIKKHRLHFRVSVDSFHPGTNQKTRKLKTKPDSLLLLKAMMDSYNQFCNYFGDDNIPMSIATVVTKHNAPDLYGTGKTLYHLGLNWRIQMLITPEYVDKNTLTKKRTSAELKDFKRELGRIKRAYESCWHERIIVKVDDQTNDFGAILLYPNGELTIADGSDKARRTVNSDELDQVLVADNHQARYLTKKR